MDSCVPDCLPCVSICMGRMLIVLLAAGCALAQDNLAIRVTVPLVNVAFTVRDADGRLISDLAKDDFEVLDDGAPQPISFFAHSVDLPLKLGLIADMSGSQDPFVKRHEHDLKTFLEKVLTPQDRAFLVCFGNHLRLASDFSSSGSDLISGLKRFDKNAEEMPELGPTERRELGTAFYDALYYATLEKLAGVDIGRRALIVFSDGEDNSSSHHMLDAIESAQAQDVVIFGIRYTERDRKGRLTARNKYGTSVMARIGHETGGLDFDAEKVDLAKSFAEIGQELRSSYELAYHAPSAGDGTFHKIVIRPKRAGLTVRSKTGYFSREGP
jgi:Ca-activated chloride channel family protein